MIRLKRTTTICIIALFLASTGRSVLASQNLTENSVNPALVYNYPSFEDGVDIAIENNIAYIADLDGSIWRFDITDPTSPIQLPSYVDSGSPHGICVEKDILYCGSWGTGLSLINVSDPAHLIKMDQYQGGGKTCEIVVENDIAYVANWDSGLNIFNVSDPFDITLMSQICDTSYSISEVMLYEQLAIITDSETGDLHFINISDPSNPSKFTYQYQGGIATYVEVINNIAFIADWVNGVTILNISDVDNATTVATIDELSAVLCVDVVEDRLYITDSEEGFLIYNITDIENPSKLGEFSAKSFSSLIVLGNYAYISTLNNGFIILAINPSSAPTGLSPTAIILLSCAGVLVCGLSVYWIIKKRK